MGTLTSAIGGANSFFGSVLPLVNNVQRTISLVDTLTGASDNDRRKQLRAEQDLALRQLQERQAEQAGQLVQSNALQNQENALRSQQADEQRRAALRRAVSRQRAQFGSQGVSSTGGSSDAVLLGFFEESETEQAQREQLDTLRSNALDQNLSNRNSLNLLQATQLAERQQLQRLF